MKPGGLRPAWIALAVVALVATAWYAWRPIEAKPAQFTGSQACAACHSSQFAAWSESHHRHAMEKPTPHSVLGDFNGAEFTYFGRTARFTKEGDAFRVTTDGKTYTVAYTLGYKPLQQYLVELDGGRLQALPFAWDGAKWFHLYPNENITSESPLHWTRPLQNVNHMCADCHTTNFAKNFSDASNTFASTWTEVGNGCESCHGPGSEHIAGRAKMTVPKEQKAQFDRCGVCHARRTRLHEDPAHEEMMQTWQPVLPRDGLYFADGQIRDEVFEIGSFLQSKMAAKGVTCTNCHDPHTARLKAEGNALCLQCHEATFDSTAHHFHPAGSTGAQCVNCHMPSRTYMVVDPRRDHRIAIPNPEQSEALHSPNACASCHLARPLPKAPKSDSFVSPIRQSDLASDDLLIKLGGIQQTMNLPPAQREPLLAPLKDHPSRAIRLTVAPLIGGSPEYREWLAHDADRAESLVALAALQSPAEARATFEKALQRDPTSLLAYLNYADFHRAQGSDAAAEPLLRKALDMYPDSASAHHTLGLLLVRQKRADAAVPELGRAADLAPNDSGYVYIYAVALYTTGKTDEALATLARARAKFPSNEAIQSAISAYCEDQRSRGRSHSTCR